MTSTRRHRKGSRKQRGGGILTSRVGGPVKKVLDAANGLIGDELRAVKTVVSSVFDAGATAVMGVARGGNRALDGVGSVFTGRSRRNSRRNRRNNNRRN